jgi:predicted RNA-binding protein
MTRNEAIEHIADNLGGIALAAVIAKGYNDNTLSAIAAMDKNKVKVFTDTTYSAETVDILTKAYSEKIIDSADLFYVMRYSTFRNSNEVDVKKYIECIKGGGISRKTATNILVADNYESGDYDALAEKVKSGAYFPTKYGTLSLSYEVARVLFKLKVPLRASRKGHIPSGVINVEDSIRYGDCIRGGSSKLVQTICKFMRKDDWDSFYKYLLSKNIEDISAEDIEKYYSDFKTASVRSKSR